MSRHRFVTPFPAAAVLSAAVLLPASGSAASPVQEGGFVANAGQTSASVLFEGRLGTSPVFFTNDGIVVVLRDAVPEGEDAVAPPTRSRERGRRPAVAAWAVKIAFESDRAPAVIEGRLPSASPSHFLFGRDPDSWRVGVATYREIVYRGVWPGIDLVFRNDGNGLAWRAEVGPEGDRSRIRFRYEGAKAAATTASGAVINAGVGRLVHDVVADASDGLLRIDSALDAEAQAGAEASPRAATRVGRGMRWSTFLGGTRDDTAYAVAAGDDGTIYIAGATRSTLFPTTVGALDTSYGGSFDAFVTALAPDGATVLWSTYLGDTNDDRAWAIRLDRSGRPVVAGVTASAAFPTTNGAYDTSLNGLYDAFVAVLTSDGTGLVWSTYLGGAAEEWDVSGLAIDRIGRVAISGSTRSSDFPATAGAYDTTLGGVEDAFVAVVEASGSALRFATHLGGSDHDVAEDIAFDATDRPVVVGRTYSSDFPVTPGAFDTTFAGGAALQDGFVAKLASSGASLVFSTFLGGDADDEPYAVAVAESGATVVAGTTESSDFPTTSGAYAETPPGSEDAFVTVVASGGASLVASTYLGGTSLDRALDLALDSFGRPILAGWTCSEDLRVLGRPWDATFNGPCDAHLAILEADLSALIYATLLGGDDDETAFALALDDQDRPYLVGDTRSGDFPTTPGAYDTSHNSAYSYYDAFVTALWPIVDYCSSASGSPSPALLVEKSRGYPCPEPPLAGNLADLVEGDLGNLSVADVGPVVAIACDTDEVVFPNEVSPPPAAGLFQLARYAGGAYTDGDGGGLVGSRVPTSGDCP